MNKNHFFKLGLPALTVRSDLYAICRLRVYFPRDCIVVNNKCIAVTNGFKLCSLISVNTHVRSKSIAKIDSNYDE